MTNIVSLRGQNFHHESKPDPEVIALLREVITRAESGEIIGAAIIFIERDGTAGTGNAGCEGRLMVAESALLHHRLTKRLDAHDEANA